MAINHSIPQNTILIVRRLLFMVVIGILISCSKEDKDSLGTLNLKFNLSFGDQTVDSPEEWHSLNDSTEMRFTKVSLYLSDITLVGGGSDLVLTDIIHLSYLQTILGDAISSSQIVIPFSHIPLNQYTGIDFGLGVNENLNNKSPADFSASQPLSFNSEYWTPWKSYIFTKIEGEYSVNDGELESFVLHTGSDEAYRLISIAESLVMNADVEKNINFDIDLYNILTSYPLTVQPRIHQLEQQEYVNMLADNFAASLRL